MVTMSLTTIEQLQQLEANQVVELLLSLGPEAIREFVSTKGGSPRVRGTTEYLPWTKELCDALPPQSKLHISTIYGDANCVGDYEHWADSVTYLNLATFDDFDAENLVRFSALRHVTLFCEDEALAQDLPLTIRTLHLSGLLNSRIDVTFLERFTLLEEFSCDTSITKESARVLDRMPSMKLWSAPETKGDKSSSVPMQAGLL